MLVVRFTNLFNLRTALLAQLTLFGLLRLSGLFLNFEIKRLRHFD